ncbi:hypothetical protein [Haloferax sp. YSSS75]|uniref:hypothetical protein n=1 Tax=Haloferax sp. YSSS75 TaxID=3388564 RepID=UPI00398D3D7B
MTRKQIGKNTGNSGRINLSGPELEKFGSEIGEPIKIDIAESKGIAQAIIENSDCGEFVIVSKVDQAGAEI